MKRFLVTKTMPAVRTEREILNHLEDWYPAAWQKFIENAEIGDSDFGGEHGIIRLPDEYNIQKD